MLEGCWIRFSGSFSLMLILVYFNTTLTRGWKEDCTVLASAWSHRAQARNTGIRGGNASHQPGTRVKILRNMDENKDGSYAAAAGKSSDMRCTRIKKIGSCIPQLTFSPGQPSLWHHLNSCWLFHVQCYVVSFLHEHKSNDTSVNNGDAQTAL